MYQEGRKDEGRWQQQHKMPVSPNTIIKTERVTRIAKPKNSFWWKWCCANFQPSLQGHNSRCFRSGKATVHIRSPNTWHHCVVRKPKLATYRRRIENHWGTRHMSKSLLVWSRWALLTECSRVSNPNWYHVEQLKPAYISDPQNSVK